MCCNQACFLLLLCLHFLLILPYTRIELLISAHMLKDQKNNYWFLEIQQLFLFSLWHFSWCPSSTKQTLPQKGAFAKGNIWHLFKIWKYHREQGIERRWEKQYLCLWQLIHALPTSVLTSQLNNFRLQMSCQVHLKEKEQFLKYTNGSNG